MGYDVQDFEPGQRWICDADLQMGLGTVLSVDQRTVTIAFKAVDESRTYAIQSAPLTRMTFKQGDEISTTDGQTIHVEVVSEVDGLLVYSGQTTAGERLDVAETSITDQISLNRPLDRLLNNQFDDNKWFQLRHDTLLYTSLITKSPLYGLSGCRTSIIPHQLYIANEVANRFAPRVLLADEVGLGKTIEAGMILHHQLLTERAHRVLILVPGALLHQWLVEMMRRFNLMFSIFDEEQCVEIEAGNDGQNPFQSEQLILCNIDFFKSNPNRYHQAVAGEWDLLIVDEAHHLQWSENDVSEEYQLVEGLAMNTKGVLLLTATPEQLGKESHFARLRLLDPDRFSDYGQFQKDEESYQPIADAVDALKNDELGNSVLTSMSAIDQLNALTPGTEAYQDKKDVMINELLDQHGTGRVLFRNTRSAIKGFPERKVHDYPLQLPNEYKTALESSNQLGDNPAQNLLCPEISYGSKSWTKIDPRVEWLVAKLQDLKPAKVLLITVNQQSATQLSDWLSLREGISAAVFHEGMNIIERDRAAAYFADQEQGCQVLVCSEIGSEGRNFQFSHHLVLFDLPLNPDLLEQRIGRLDRIGQTQTIHIHVPYFQDSAQAVLYHWYHEGLDAFETTCPAGFPVYNELKQELVSALITANVEHHELPELIDKTRRLYISMNDLLQEGRDRLLEYNSCRPSIASELEAEALRLDKTTAIEHYMDRVFDCFGVTSEDNGPHNYIISPGEHMVTQFPGLYDEGMTITFNRQIALSNENIHYLSWEHPMVMTAADMVKTSEFGNSVLISVEHDNLDAGLLLIELIYLIDVPLVRGLDASRYFSGGMLRLLIDEKGRTLNNQLSFDDINQVKEAVSVNIARQIVQMKQNEIEKIVQMADKKVNAYLPELISDSIEKMSLVMDGEIARLKSLAVVNKNIRPEEIEFLQQRKTKLDDVYNSATVRLDAIRVMIAT
jgi:ATP-dependent helicase HepA